METPAWVETLKNDIISSLKSEVENITEKFKKEIKREIKESMESAELVKKVEINRKEINEQHSISKVMQRKCRETNERLQKLESYTMRENLVFSGIPEQEGETEDAIRKSICDVFRTKMNITNADQIRISRCHRLNRTIPSNKTGDSVRPRDIIVRFQYYPDRMSVLHSGKMLKGSGIYVNEHFPREIEQKRRILLPIIKYAKQQKKKAILIQDKLIIDGKPYYLDTIHNIPFDISMISTKTTDNHVLFGGRLSKLSNFYNGDASFTIDGITYVCVEQYYQCAKANFVKDFHTVADIMIETDPAEMKHLGNSIKLSTAQLKKFKALEVMERGVWEKFHQNPNLLDVLKGTGDLTLVECNIHDSYWAIGRSLHDDLADNKKEWKGDNHLGNILMKVRSSL